MTFISVLLHNIGEERRCVLHDKPDDGAGDRRCHRRPLLPGQRGGQRPLRHRRRRGALQQVGQLLGYYFQLFVYFCPQQPRAERAARARPPPLRLPPPLLLHHNGRQLRHLVSLLLLTFLTLQST